MRAPSKKAAGGKGEEDVSKSDLVSAYQQGRLSRRRFLRLMTAAGVSVAAASAYADWLAPRTAVAQTDGDFYPTTTTTKPTTTTTVATSTSKGEVEGSTSVRPGERKVFKNSTPSPFAPNAPLGLEFQSAPVSLGTTTADGSGNFRVTITIPTDATAGAHRLVARGARAGGGTHEVIADITVVVASGTLSLTGTEVGALGGAGIAAAAGGGLMVRASRWYKRIKGSKATPTDGPPSGWGDE